VQTETDPGVTSDDKRMRKALGIDPNDEELRLSWTELHDALTALQAHQKAIPYPLNASDLEIINKRVRRTIMSTSRCPLGRLQLGAASLGFSSTSHNGLQRFLC
jgi:hypothetical protein